eukprot:s2403_g8.t1
MAARTKNLINKLGRDGNPVTDPHVNFLQFLKDITNATVGNKLVLFGEALLKALSHFGMVRVPRDRVGQIFQGKRGRQYVVIREEFHMNECGSRFAYRVSKDYGNVFYKDYLKHVRWQLLCIVLDKDSGPIDDKLIKDYGLNRDEVQKAIEDSGEVFIAPIAVDSDPEEKREDVHTNAKGGFFGGRDIEMYLRGIEGTKNLCKIMKYIIQVGITPEFIAKKLTDIADADEEDRPDIRREVSNFIRKMISGAFAVRSYDYFRVTPPNREDHIHMDPVSLACAAVERGRTFAVLYTLNKEFVNDTGWHNDTTYFKLILVDIPYATLAITATGNSSGDACSTAALQMVCDFDNATEGVDSRFTTGPEWQTFGSPEPIDDEHQSGEGSWWDVPCSSSAPAPLTTFDGRLSSVPSIWASGHKYASFRWVPSDLVKCHFSLEQFDSLFYGGQNFTDYVEGNQSDPSEAFHLEFAFHEHAYLVISGQDISGAPCTGSSLRVSCSNGIITERNWEAFGAGEAIEDRYKAGLGLGWRSPCTSTAPSEWISELTPSASIWATGGTFAAFRWKRPERVKCQITSHVVEAVYYNGVDLTPTLTGDLLEFNDTKTFEFRHVQEAYLAITVKGAEGSCSSDGFFIICSNGVTSSRGWQAFQGTPVDITHRQGGGAGWTEPCHSSLEWWPGGNGRYLPGLWSPGATEVTFRWLDMESWELALKAGWEDGTFNYNAQIWQDGSSSTFGTGAAYRNTKTEAYSQLKVKRVKLVVDNMAAVFSLPADVQYRYTLQELASAHDSSVFRAALSQRGLEATGFAAAHLGDARTCGFGFDLRSSSSVRLGILLGNSDCSAETGSEGLGLLQSGSNLGSGLLEGGQQVWGRVEVFVEGPALQQNEVRLSEISEGRVEIFKDSQWGTIDDSLFDNLDAAVICRQLSFFGGMKLPSDQVLQSFQLTPAMSNVSCMGYEREVAACSGDLVEKELRAQIGMSGTDAGVRCLRESVLEVMWVGCYADDYYHDLDFGPQATGYNTRTCAEACQDFRYMALQNGGWCSCGDHFSTSAQYLVAADSECGNLCSGEELLSPSRYCGGFERNAIYALKKGAFQPGLLATYYTFNQGCTFQDLTFRTPDESRIDADVNYEATRNPWAGFTFADHFAAQWNGFLVLDTTGSYTFQLDSDDGSRMYLEGVQIIDHDGCRATSQVGPVTPPKQYSKQMLKGHYEIKLEHFENTWEAKMIFALQRPSDASPEPVPASQLRSSPGLVIPGVRADFFAFTQSCSFQDLEERIPNASRVDPLVEYVLGNETHAQPWRGLVFANDFAARWMGYILITSPGTYIFQVEAADCHRFSVDDVYLVERPGCHPFESNNGTAVLTEGFHRVTLEYFEKSEASSIRLSYSGPDTQEAMKVVPSEVLWSSAGTLQVGTNTKFYVTFQSCNTFMDLSSLIPDVLRFDQQIDYPSSSSAWTGLSFADHFAVSWAGFIIITFPGKYTFQVNVEDGARLLVEKVLVAASAACGAQTLTASLELVQGYHYFELQYFEVTGNAAAILSYQGPDTSNVMTVIPSSVLRYSPDTLVPTEGQVQLRGITSGRLEIYHNHQWGTVCDDNFDDVDALVVCRQLGFSTGRSLGNSVPEGAGPIWMDEVNCLGNETRLDQCSFLNWGEHDCAHSEDVGVDCTQDPVLPVEGDLRLSGGNIGRLDVYHAGTWGTVCNSGFTDAEARVACRQMGYCCGILSQSTAPVGTGPIWLADLQCVGYEQRLDECGVSTGSWGNNTCTRSQDVAINCMDGASCLASGTHLYSPGDVGLKIYVSGINVVQPKATLPSIAEFVLTCPSCSKDTTVFLASSCNETEVATGMRTEEALLENSTSLSQWSTYLNTTELLLGQYFRLCVDADGAGTTLAIGDAGHEIYLQLLSVLTGVVLAAPLQRVDVRAEDVNNTNFQMFLSVAAEGCAIELNSAQPPPVKRTTHIGTPLLVNGNVWSFEVDASGLEIGDHAVVCEDYDADTGPLRPGPASGPQVYVSGAVVTTSETIRRRPLQYIYLQCAAGCDTRSWGFLATDCDAPMPGRKTAGAHFQGVAPSFNLTLDATDLEAGYRYLLCTDLDGPMTSRLKAGPAVGSGPFVAGVELVRTHFIQALDAELVELVCSADCRGFVSGVSTIFLSLASCTDVEPGFLGNESTTLSVLTGLPPTFSANVNASGLKTGLRYQVCVDLDGAGAEKPSGYSLFDVYVSGVISVISPPAVRTSSDVQTVVLECLPDECSEASTAFLAAGCTISANQGPPLRTSEVSFLPTNNATLWEVNFPLVGLTMGTNYRICVDMDGSPGLAMASINSTATGLEFPIGESGLSLYVAPLGPSLPPPSTIRSEMNQEVLARCVTQPCRTLVLPGSTATAFLAAADVRCSEAQALTPHSTLRNHPSLPDAWLVTFDARSLTEGRTYRLCIDADGSRSTLQAGDSLVNVFISPLQASGSTVMPEQLQQVSLPCVSACVAALAAPFAYLVAKAPEDERGCTTMATPFEMPVLLSSHQASHIVATFNASKLIAGYHYELCLAAYRVLEDEPEAGMSGALIFVSGITAARGVLPEPQGGLGVQTAAGQGLVLSCGSAANCSTDSEGSEIFALRQLLIFTMRISESRSHHEGLVYGDASLFANLPMDNLDLLIALLKNDLNALAKCASTCRFWKAEMQDALFRAWHCRACKSKLLHRRFVRRFNEACFQDGPALVCELDDEGMRVSGMKTMKTMEFFDGSGAFEAFRFAQSRKKENPICLEQILAQSPGHGRIRQSHFIYCKACQRFLGCRLQMTREDARQPFETPSGLDILLLCLPYLLELDAEGRVPVRKLEHETIFHCSGRWSNGVCGARLFRLDSVLSEQHAWRKPESRRVEPAWYINNFFVDAVNVGRPSCSHLAQGVMETATVWCSKCEATVGWKFVKDLCSKKPNVHYVHRFGVCESSVLELAAEDPSVDTLDADDQSLALDMEEEDEEHEEDEEDYQEDASSEDLSLDGLQDDENQEVFLVGEQSTGSLLTAAGAALTSPAALTPVGQEWFVTIDASSLTAGKYYLLCVDLFGIAPPGCTGFMVFASSLSASTQSVGFAGSQLVTFSCASGCISSSSVYLARDCSTGYGGPKTVPTPIVATHGNLWTAVHQADALISGFRYQMCVDMDGSGALPTGPSGVVVYVSGVSRVFPSYVSDDLEQKVVLECGEEMPCRASRARLVRDSCSSNTSDATEWRSISAGVNGSILNVLTDGLAAGAHYILCTEMEAPSESFLANETLDVGDSGFTLYVSPLQAFGPMILLPTQQQVLTLNCTSSANCTSKTQGFLSQSCGSGGPLAPMMNEMADRTSAATLEVENEMLAQWRLTLDTSQLIPGRHYKLCVDMDGGEDSFQPGQSSSIQIFISPVIPADVQTVKTIQDQRISMQCVNGAACSTTSVWYLTTGSCGEPGDASLQPQPMSLLQAVGRLAFGGQAGHWMAQLDGRQLQAGVHYRLCLDLDSAGALWAGDTGLEVYASGILSLAPAQIMISATERVNLTCVAGGCLSGAMLWLASRCETPLTSLERFASIQATEAAVVFDTTAVQAGQWLELCSDLDGQESLRYGSTGLYVYISGILAVNDPWMQTWVGRLTLDCATSACSSGAEAFLALDCGSRPGQVIQTPAAQLQDVPDLYEDEEISSAAERKEIVLNLQILVPGVHYRLCTDLDGSGPMTTFYSGFDVYVTSLRQATPDLVVKRQVQQSVLLECDPSGCPPNTAEAFAAENCSTDTPPSGARLMQSPSGTLRRIATVDASTLSSRWYNLCIDVDGQASSGLQAGAVGNIFVSPISQIFPLTLGVAGQHPVKIECSTCTEETQVFLSLTCLLQNASNVTALLPSLPGNSWTAMLTTYHTEPGLFYQLCVVVENVTGPSGEALFVAPDVSLQQEAILRNQMQLISLDCKRGCASLTHVTLATECSRWDTMQQAPVLSSNVISSPTAPTTSSGGIFLASLDASTMPAGQIVTLCLGSQDRAMGEGGLSLFVSPISATSTSVIFNAPSQSLQLNCTGCSTLSEVYLALNCSVNASSATNRTPAAPLIASGGGYQWAAQLDATHLEPGIHYEICIDLDGEELTDFPSGKAMWQVYASAFSSPGHFSLPLSPNSQLKVPCLGCSSAQGFLADSCPSRNLQPEDAVNYSNASRFTDACLGGSEAATDATSFFVLQLDTCSLAPGSHLPLCTDMDGFSSRLQIGDSGIEVYVSPVTSSVGPSRLVKGQSSVLTVACTGCISGLSTAQLAIECDESPNAVPLAISPNSTSAVQLQEGSQGFTASFDTRGLGSGRQYRVCLDLDGAGTQYRAGDSGISMYLTAIASISFDEREESEPSQFGRRLASVAAGRVLELVMLCLPGGGGCGTESEGFLSLMGECTPISPAQQLQKLPSFYGLAYERFGLNLSTAALPAGYTYQICVDADGPGIIFPAGETGYTIYISPVRMAVSWGSVLRLVCEPGGCGSSTSGFLAADCTDSTKPMGAMGRMYAVAGRPKPWPEILYLTNESAMVTAEHWESSIDAPPGHPMRLCLDVDGSGPMPIGDARGIYTSSVQELFTHGVPQGLDEVITLACHATGSCSETTQAYLAKTCDIHDLDAGTIEVLGEQTACSFLVPDNSSEAANETEVFSVHLRTDGLAAGWHYRLCMDLDGSALAMPTGDTLHQVYLSPVREVEPMKSAGYVQLRFNCSECSQLSEGFLALDCYEGALVLQPLNGNMSEDSDGSSSEVDPANFTGATFTGSSAFMLDALGGNWTLGISTQTLHGGVRYRFCMDLDGIDRQYLVGDTGLTVFISPITDVRPVVLAASNSSLTLLCQRGGCSFLLHSYLARDCQAPPSPSQCSYVQEDVEETNESNDTNGTNESNVTQFVDPQLGPPIQVESSPLSSINALGSAEFSADLDLTCTKPGRYRLCIVGQEETTFGAIATHIEDSGFYIDVV